MDSRSDLKVAHVRRRGSEKVLIFPKATTRGIPPEMLFGKDVGVKVFRDGVPFELNSTKIATRGVSLDDLKDFDRVEVISPDNFYERLLLQERRKSGVIVWMDELYRAALENKMRGVPDVEPVRASA